ncbi:hypothetical protein B0H10DRAFT_1659240, partial [Mycena sp. CBHHK59/15]
IVTLDIFEGSVTKEHFLGFLREQVVRIYSISHLVVILDNCSIHHDNNIRALIEGECG